MRMFTRMTMMLCLLAMPWGLTTALAANPEHLAEVRFQTGESTLTQKAADILDRFAAHIKSMDLGKCKIVIEGYTDAQGNYEKNMKLGMARAETVKALLVKKSGLAADKFLTKSWGEEIQLLPCANSRGLNKNRRVTFVLTSGGVDSVTLANPRMAMPGPVDYE